MAKLPDYVVKGMRDIGDEKTGYTTLGVLWRKDKDGEILLSGELHSFPLSGKILVVPYTPPEPKEDEKQAPLL